jgi:hypothetical protein
MFVLGRREEPALGNLPAAEIQTYSSVTALGFTRVKYSAVCTLYGLERRGGAYQSVSLG